MTAVVAAQNAGRVVGGVVDSTGAVLQEATVTLINTATALERQTRSDAEGQYELRQRASLRVNVKNVFNERYYLSGAGTNVAYPAPPRTVQAALQVGF